MSREKENLTAYVTKYTLTRGILTVQGEFDTEYPGMLVYRRDGSSYYEHAHGKDWHRTIEAAKADADKRRKKRIVALQKTIKKLEALTF